MEVERVVKWPAGPSFATREISYRIVVDMVYRIPGLTLNHTAEAEEGEVSSSFQ